jgi:THO complex subunit 2
MANIHKRWLSAVSSRSGPSNALSNSVLLDDDDPASSSSAAEVTGPPPKPPPEQRIQLLQALLSIGDLPDAEFLLARFPWVAQSHPVISDVIMQIVSHALEGVYRSFVAGQPEGIDDRELELDGSIIPLDAKEKEVVPTLYNPPPPETPTKRFELFYPAWSAHLEKWERPEEIREKGLRWLSLTRGLGARTVDVMVKICRLGAAHFAALRREKEAALGLVHGAKTKDELRSVEVGEHFVVQEYS